MDDDTNSAKTKQWNFFSVGLDGAIGGWAMAWIVLKSNTRNTSLGEISHFMHSFLICLCPDHSSYERASRTMDVL